MSRAHALTLLALAACAEQHLSIGRLDSSAPTQAPEPPRDSGVRPPAAMDAAPPFDASHWTLHAELRALGREPVDQLRDLCGGRCVELSARTDGGTPPYRVQWWDGVVGDTRSLCARDWPAAPPPYLFLVEDSAPVPAQGGMLSVISPCASASPNTRTSWFVCFRPPPFAPTACPDGGVARGVWTELEPALSGIDSSHMLTLSIVWAKVLRLGGAETLCGPTRTLAEGLNGVLTPFLSGRSSSDDPPIRYVQLEAVNEPDGMLPEGVRVSSYRVCFDAPL
jgi:hypothetical protein